MMLESKTVEVGGKSFILSKFPSWEGVMLMSRLPPSMLPKVGDFGIYKECFAEVMRYVFVPMPSGAPLSLSSPELINNHVPDWEATALLFKMTVEYNTSFLRDGRLSSSLNGITSNSLPELIAKTFHLFSQLSSAKDLQPLES